MRFITLARRHKSKSFEVLCGPEIPLQEQFKKHREFVHELPAHKDYAEVICCELHDAKAPLKFVTPEVAKADREQTAKDAEASKQAAESAAVREKKRNDELAAKEAKRREETLAKINEQHDAIRNRDGRPKEEAKTKEDPKQAKV